MTLVSWAVGKQFLWDVAVVDFLNLIRTGTTAAEAEERKKDKYKDLLDDGYLFQALVFEIQGAAGPSK